MASRLELHEKLVELLGNEHVYYQPPESFKLEYPCIVYSKSKIDIRKADDITYSKNTRYDITVLDKMPDNPVIEKLLELPYSSYDRNYKSDNLNHDVVSLYY